MENYKQCSKCKDSISKFTYKRHFNVCNGKFKNLRRKRKKFLLENISIKINDNLFECKKCQKQFTKFGIGNHYWRSHTKDGKLHNPLKNGNKTTWNKGLTKETDERVRNASLLISKALKGKVGKKHSNETKLKLSKIRKEYLKDNNISRWNILRNQKSYPEKVFIEIVNSLNIKSHDIISEYFEEGYFIDFAFINNSDKVAVEIDGSQHFEIKDRVKSDKKKDRILKLNGWRVFRIVANDLIKKKFDIKEFKNFLLKNNKDNLKSYKKKFTDFIKHKELKNLEKDKIKLEKQKIGLNKIEERKQLILNSNIDFNKKHWKSKLSRLLKISVSQVSRFTNKYMNEFYLKYK